jgi:two-component system OmpR family sensor kinase
MTQAVAAADPPPTTARAPWSLQTRLIVTVIGIVGLLLLVVAAATSTILGTVLKQGLDSEIASTARSIPLFSPGFPPEPLTAHDALSSGRAPYGFLLLLRAADGSVSGAVVGSGDGTVTTLTPAQQRELQEAVHSGSHDVTLTGLGGYRITAVAWPTALTTGVAGLPLRGVNETIGVMLLTVGLVTAAGLVVLAGAIIVLIRVGLRPLRAVADTATRVAALPMAEGAVSIAERVPAAESDDRTEIGRVGAALNTLLDHVDSSLEARQRNEERMRRFVADASHELRTPLSSIRGYSELSLRALRHPRESGEQGTLVDDTESSLERIQAQSVRMSALIEDLLLLARLDEGQELVYGTVDLTRLAIEAVGDARAAGADHDWQLDVGPEPVVVAGDTGRLHQVIANLLANARTHTPAGSTVTVSVQQEGTDAVLRVHDDGPGIDPGIADELFERFARADRSRARKTGGTGLGLSIVKAIVEAHHGSVTVDGVPGDTTFTVRLPAARPAEPHQ